MSTTPSKAALAVAEVIFKGILEVLKRLDVDISEYDKDDRTPRIIGGIAADIDAALADERARAERLREALEEACGLVDFKWHYPGLKGALRDYLDRQALAPEPTPGGEKT